MKKLFSLLLLFFFTEIRHNLNFSQTLFTFRRRRPKQNAVTCWFTNRGYYIYMCVQNDNLKGRTQGYHPQIHGPDKTPNSKSSSLHNVQIYIHIRCKRLF